MAINRLMTTKPAYIIFVAVYEPHLWWLCMLIQFFFLWRYSPNRAL